MSKDRVTPRDPTGILGTEEVGSAALCGSTLRVRSYVVGLLLALLAAVGLSLTLVAGGGSEGAAVAAVVGETLLAAMSMIVLVWSGREMRLPSAGVLLVLGCAGLALGAGWLLEEWPVAGVAVATAVFLLGLKLVHRFPPEISHAFGAHGPGAILARLRPSQ